MPLVAPFRTSFGTSTARDVLLVRVDTATAEGGASASPMPSRLYSSEYVDGAPDVIAPPPRAPAGWPLASVTAARVAVAAAPRQGPPDGEGGAGDGRARRRAARRRASRSPTTSGAVTTGCLPACRSASTASPALLDAVAGYLDDGYLRIKLKIEPGWDVEPVRAVRERFGDDVLLQVDANTAYTLADARHLARLDDVRPAADRAAAGRGRRARPRRPGPAAAHAGLPRRVDRVGAVRRRRDRARRLLDRQHQARPGRRLPRGPPHPRRVRRQRRAGVVRRHARDRARPGRQRRARRAAGVHAARRHVGLATGTTRSDITEPFVPRRRPPGRCRPAPASGACRWRTPSPSSRRRSRWCRCEPQRGSDAQGLRGRAAAAADRAGRPAGVGHRDPAAAGRRLRGPGRRRQGRHDQADHRSTSTRGSPGSSRCRRRPSASARSGTSSATSSSCPRPARSCCSTGPGTTGPASSG